MDSRGFAEAILQSIQAFDPLACEERVAAAAEQFPVEVLIGEVYAPALREAGIRWHDGRLSIVQEHLLSAAVKRQLAARLGALNAAARGPSLAFTTLSGERHEMGSLMAAVFAAARGVRALHLGPDLPPAEIGRLSRHVRLEAIAISVVTSPEVFDAYGQFESLRASLQPGVELWVGGTGARLLEDGLLPPGTVRMTRLDEFDERLRALATRPGGKA
jgi:MerR family transcriptional regulator, light-induced transcriptional regulator